ncbi:MAG: hypothetical protein AAF921_06700 [Cyanobacteria bacterium P01_D01_bin.44]
MLGLSGALLLLSTLLVGRIVRRHLIGQRVALAAGNGTNQHIFSRESFRTFSEAYDIARETIERKKRDRLQSLSFDSLSSDKRCQVLDAKYF